MSDVECPYCEKYQEICHDDGYGYCEDEQYQQDCLDCGKVFSYTTSITFNYFAEKADCLNGSIAHDMREVFHAPKLWPNWKRCTVCGKEEKGNIAMEPT